MGRGVHVEKEATVLLSHQLWQEFLITYNGQPTEAFISFFLVHLQIVL